MKSIFSALLILAVNLSVLQAQTQKVFKIDYHAFTTVEEMDKLDGSGDFSIRAWVNDTYNKVQSHDTEQGYQVINKKTNKSFVVFSNLEQYHILNDGSNPEDYEDATLDVKLIPGKTKNIAGYECKLAELNADFELEENEDYTLQVWYTDKIPNLSWGQFSFLKKIPGAALAVLIEGNGFAATKISQETIAESELSIPENYTAYDIDEMQTEMEDDSTVDASIQEDTPVDEDRFLYYNESGDLMGLKDENDNAITKAEYSYFDYFVGGITTVINSESKYGSMDKNGNIKIPFQHDFLAYDNEYQQYLYAEGEKFGILSANNTPLIKAQYDMVSHMSYGMLTATLGDKTGIINGQNQILVPISYPIIIEFNQDVFVTVEGEDYVLYSIKENKKIAGGYDLITLSEKDPIHLVQKGDKYGYINNQGKLVIPIQYTSATSFDEGVASVADSEDGTIYFINTKGQKVEID